MWTHSNFFKTLITTTTTTTKTANGTLRVSASIASEIRIKFTKYAWKITEVSLVAAVLLQTLAEFCLMVAETKRFGATKFKHPVYYS